MAADAEDQDDDGGGSLDAVAVAGSSRRFARLATHWIHCSKMLRPFLWSTVKPIIGHGWRKTKIAVKKQVL